MSASTTNADFPIRRKLIHQQVCGHATDIVYQHFSDRIFFVVSQYEKMGTLIEVRRDVALEQNTPVTYTTKVLQGEDLPLDHVIARCFASRLDTSIPILFGLALKDKTRESTKEIEDIIANIFSKS